MFRAVQPMCASLALLTPAVGHAQETMTFTIEYSSPVLRPGQSQNMKVWAFMQPGIGQAAVWNTLGGSGQVLPVLAFSGAHFDLSNLKNGQTGSFSNLVLNPALLASPGAGPGTPDGNGNVLGILAFQFHLSLSQANPILIWSADWTPINYEPRIVTFNTLHATLPLVWLELGLGGVQDEWTSFTVPNSFQVVPSPSSSIALALGALFALRRRR